eukprot:c13113_g1_i1.p1 GENE.c13113_g1_i1~~c13113_g1_i1.p1  ORF type:complete len:423 (-),score=62.79 c13113_g1_i1:225-1493(-)
MSATQVADRELFKERPLPTTTTDNFNLAAITKLVVDSEKEFDALVAEHLQRLFDPWIVFNGEEFKWIDTKGAKSNFQKTDFNICHPALIQRKDPPSCAFRPKVTMIRGQAEEKDKPLLYGIPAHWGLRDAVIVLESKLPTKLKEGLGEMVTYLFHLSLEPCIDEDRPHRFGMVLSCNEFYLVEAEKATIIRLFKGKWDTPGCGTAIRDFFFPHNSMGAYPRWLRDAEWLCKEMNVDFALDSSSPAFLGMGAYGRVFRVKSKEKEMALKVATSKKYLDLAGQYYSLIDAKAKNANVVSVHTLVQLSNGAAGYLIEEVGAPVRKQQISVSEFLGAMRNLHSVGCVHGDCRLSNLIRYQDKLLWIDFKGTKAFQIATVVDDVQHLIQSLRKRTVDQKVVNDYASDVNNDDKFAVLEQCVLSSSGI